MTMTKSFVQFIGYATLLCLPVVYIYIYIYIYIYVYNHI